MNLRIPFFRPTLSQLLTVVGIVVVAGSLWFSNRLVQELADAERRRLDLYVEVLKFNAQYDNEETAFLFNNVIRAGASNALINVPAIITDTLGNVVADNLVLDAALGPPQRAAVLRAELADMQADPSNRIVIEYATGQYQILHYRESQTLRLLRYYPYITLFILLFLITIAFFNFSISQRNSLNKLWAGLAKETAHQLGTPISGLIAWIELLKLRADERGSREDAEVAAEMQADVVHLQNIAERFSKIGSEPELDWHPLQPMLAEAAEYVRSRIARSGRFSILLASELPPGYQVQINPILFQWVIENLVKNAIDAMAGMGQGAIVLRASHKHGQTVLEVEDTGRGIPKQHVKDVFKPGFTTKKRGWGLGLSLSKRIIENYHRGRITVRKSEPGKGTTFRIVLPAGSVQPAPAPAAAPVPAT